MVTNAEAAHPRSWRWQDDGDVLDGRFGRIDTVPGTDFYGKPITKVVIEIDLIETDETITLWVDDAKLRGLLGRELKARNKPDIRARRASTHPAAREAGLKDDGCAHVGLLDRVRARGTAPRHRRRAAR